MTLLRSSGPSFNLDQVNGYLLPVRAHRHPPNGGYEKSDLGDNVGAGWRLPVDVFGTLVKFITIGEEGRGDHRKQPQSRLSERPPAVGRAVYARLKPLRRLLEFS